jgi:hypothetical protein
VHIRPIRPRARGATTAVALLVAALFLAAAPARAADCALADFAYNAACGPEFTTPAWGDGAGWTDPSKYSTIQLADLSGDGIDELIGRNDDGLEIWRFDTTVGQWRPAIGADGQPEVLRDFRSPLPWEAGPSWKQAMYYATIQTADLNGDGRREILARFPNGMHVFGYTPPSGSKGIDGGTWKVLSANGPFDDGTGYTDPSQYLTIHAIDAVQGQPGALVAQSSSDLVMFRWNGSGWTQVQPGPLGLSSTNPRYYLNLQTAELVRGASGSPSPVQSVVTRNGGGISAQYLADGRWQALGAQPNPGPFGDIYPSPDCPFTAGGDDSQCFTASPSFYETLRFGDVVGDVGAGAAREMLGRATDGLRVWQLSSDGTRWSRLSTLTDLQGGANLPPGRWSSIRLGRILGQKNQQVLALDGTGVQAWTYNASGNSWTKLAPSAPLALGGTMWDSNPSYYATIQTGDVTGNGHDAVIARGPFGIRTWFYDLRPGSGWTSWLPQDTSSYPQFTGGQAAAFTTLNTQARQAGVIPQGAGSVRDIWTQENAPSADQLNALQQGILRFAGCSGGAGGNPPYASCTPPAGSSGFTAADWTAVVNQVLAELGWARSVGDFFASLEALREKSFLAYGAELNAIAGKLNLEGAAGNETDVEGAEIASSVLGIVGALAALLPGPGEGIGTALDVAGELVGLVASTSPTLTSEFPARYADLQAKFATMLTETDKGLEVQSQEVRQSYGLLRLVAQLTAGNGPWSNPDNVGLESANDQGFALWVNQQLLPSLYARYDVSECARGGSFNLCGKNFAPGPETIGDDDAFTTIGPFPTKGDISHPATPCDLRFALGTGNCVFTSLPNDIATKVWGPLSDTCRYVPGNSLSKWTFDCNVGVNKDSSVPQAIGTLNGWTFTNYCFDALADTDVHPCSATSGRVTLGPRGRVTLAGTVALRRGFRVRSARIGPGGLLNQRGGPWGGRPDLARTLSGRPLRAVAVAVGASPGRAGRARSPRVRLVLGRTVGRARRYRLTVDRVRVAAPSACRALAASDAREAPPAVLTTVLRLSDGARTRTLRVRGHWRCVRGGGHVVRTLRPLASRRPARRPGLRVSLAGPRAVTPGALATYRVRLTNARPRRQRLVASLWRVRAHGATFAVGAGGPRRDGRQLGRSTWRIKELRRGRTAVRALRVRVPRTSATRVCVAAGAVADSARPAAARICARVLAAAPVTG